MIRFSCEYWSLIALFRDQLVMLNVQSFHQALFPLTIALSLKVVVLKCLSSCCLGWIISKFNFQIHPPIHLIRLQLGSWNIIVQVQQQLLYDFMISSAFPFLALNFTPVSMACHRHTCTPCPCRHTGLASGGMVWAGVSISSWSSLIRVCYECHVHVGFSTSPRDFFHAVSPPTFPRGNQQSSFFEV